MGFHKSAVTELFDEFAERGEYALTRYDDDILQWLGEMPTFQPYDNKFDNPDFWDYETGVKNERVQ